MNKPSKASKMFITNDEDCNKRLIIVPNVIGVHCMSIIYWILHLLRNIFQVILGLGIMRLHNVAEELKGFNRKSENQLFPSISRAYITEHDLGGLFSNARPCATKVSTRLMPFKNEKGEIDWTYTDDTTPGSELDCSKIDVGQQPKEENNIKKAMNEDSKHSINLSRTMSNSSNSESVISNEKSEKKERGETPLTSHSCPFMSPGNDAETKLDGELDENRLYNCPHCDAVFKIRGYLTRHIKKHATNKAYKCPFHKFSVYIDEGDVAHKCHPTGGFSRRDTYKTHLKSRHFKYPKGTRTKDRSNTPGHCSMCGEYFENSEIWCEIHIEGSECKYLPAGFKGKSIIKNRIKKQLSKQRSKKMDHNVLDSSKARDTPNSNTSNTPRSFESSGTTYDYVGSHSPDFSISSSVGGSAPYCRSENSGRVPLPQVVNNVSPLTYNKVVQPVNEMHIVQTNSSKNDSNFPVFEQFHRDNTSVALLTNDDYDDEFCLDIDQLSRYSAMSYGEIIGCLNELNQRQQIENSRQQHASQTHT